MKSKNPVYSETLMIAIGEVICVAIMLGLFALAGHFDRHQQAVQPLGASAALPLPMAGSGPWRILPKVW